MNLCDAHNHLQDDRLAPWRAEILAELPSLGIQAAVVNGSAEDDWEAVAALAREHPWITPSFGLHPWYVKERSPRWLGNLARCLGEIPRAAVGEIGLDRWIENPDIPAQTEVFRAQMEIAVQFDRPVTIHCLRAWGLLDDLLHSLPLPRRGFLLHSYGGSRDLVPKLARLGAYFSLSPYFCHERKAAQLETFAHVPLDRLLAETDAPDMWPPDALNDRPLLDASGKPLNHPANLIQSYRALASLRGLPLEELAMQLEENFKRLFVHQ